MSGSILNRGNEILANQPDDTLQAGVTLDGAQVSVKDRIGKSKWSWFAWFQQLWKGGGRSAGAGITRDL